MGLRSLRQIVFALHVLAIYHAGYGCSQPRYWRSKGVGMRAIHADIVILAKVVRSPFRTRQTTKFPQFGPYDARFRIICTLKGRLRANYVNVSGFGYIPGHCVSSRAQQNATYITLLRKRRGRYFVAEVNSQVGTIPFKKSILRKVVRRLRRKGELNKTRNGCAALLRTTRKSARASKVNAYENSALENKSDLTATKTVDRVFGLTTSAIERNRGLRFKSSWLAVILVGCVGYLLT